MSISRSIFRSLPKIFKKQSAFPLIQDTEVSCLTLGQAIESGKTFASGRMGYTELAIVIGYLAKQKIPFFRYSKELLEKGTVYAGIFPQNQNTFDEFAKIYLEALSHLDFIMAWDQILPFESSIVLGLNPNISVLKARAMIPFESPSPWTRYLEGKKVLVVHPFERSIRQQYDNCREKLFKNPLILPKFDLTIVAPPLTNGTNAPANSTWKECLHQCQEKIAKENFDIALVSGGAYGLPLTAFIKTQLKKPVIHLAGSLQLLFGIRGKRWDERKEMAPFFNEYWCKPMADERPRGFEQIEGGSYF